MHHNIWCPECIVRYLKTNCIYFLYSTLLVHIRVERVTR